MSTKTSTLYNNVFNKIKEIILLSEYNFNLSHLQSDFEIAIIKEFKNVFSVKINILGCYFLFIKAI